VSLDRAMNASHYTISAKDGRTIQIYEAGSPDGVPVLVQRGTPQCALPYRRWVEDAQGRGIRLIGYARPGYGGSTAQPDRTVAAAADDVAAIARELGLKRLLMWGVSGGGPHALACAALLPGLVVAAAALACPTPYPADGLDYFAGMGATNVALGRAALQGRDACVRCVEADPLLRATPGSLAQSLPSLLCPADTDVLATDFADFVLRTIRDGCGETRAGWIDDEIALMRPWGFELSRIRIPVLVMQGGQDLMVPFSHGKWLASRIPEAEPRLLSDDGHITLSLRRIPEVHAWLLGKI
jgi:pimeloyl-ACP methyl ester carboxylesterase